MAIENGHDIGIKPLQFNFAPNEFNIVIRAKLSVEKYALYLQSTPSDIKKIAQVLQGCDFDVHSVDQVEDFPSEEMWLMQASRDAHMNLCNLQCEVRDDLFNIANRISESEFLKNAYVTVCKYARTRYVFLNGYMTREFVEPPYLNTPADWK